MSLHHTGSDTTVTTMESHHHNEVRAPQKVTAIQGVLLGDPAFMTPFIEAFERSAPHIRLALPEDIAAPEAVTFALAWYPAEDAFHAYPNLRLVSSIAAGVNGIIDNPSLPAHVPLMRISGEAQGQMMAGFVTWQVLWYHRRFGDYLAHQRQTRWERFPKRDASDVRIGLLGAGRMGGAVARALLTLGYDVAVYSRSGRQLPEGAEGFSGRDGLERIAERSEMLINLLPLTEQTRGILDAALFARMPKGAVLIQVGRGEHLVEADLLAALDSGQLSAASMDVFAIEPLPQDHPIWHHEKILVTPHDGCDSTPPQVAREAAEALRRLDEGRLPDGLVDREAGY